MNRRSFLKLSAITGIAALVPLEFIIDNRDNETKFLEYVITTYDDEIAVIEMLKRYGWNQSQGAICTYFREFVKRQPNVVAWLKERIVITRKSDGTRICSNPKYDLYRSNIHEIEKWRKWTDETYPKLERKFNLKPKEMFAKNLLA